MNKVLSPRRTHEAIITVSSSSWKEFSEELDRCVAEIKSTFMTSSSGGGFHCTNWNGEYIKTETSEEQYKQEWEEFNKIRFKEHVQFCPECHKFSSNEA